MAQRIVLIDDLDGSPASKTVQYSYGGQSYEIDLTEEHASELDTLLARYVEHSRKVEEVQPQPQPRQRRARKTQGEHRGPEELGAIRQWARDQGMKVSDRGRVSADILQKYDAAH